MVVCEVDRRAALLGDLGVLHHLAALVVGHAETQGAWHLVQLVAEPDGGCRGRGAIHFGQDDRRVERSTSVLTAERLLAPMIRSPSQCPGIRRSSISGSRRW